jgi:aminocarboxymuconate-semialdehyde decarboxylase
MPYQTGRMNHGWQVRPEGKAHLKEAPEVSIRRLYFDCILHFEPALRYLVETFGADHVLLGSDYPFDMGMMDGVRQIRALRATPEERKLILGEAAAWLLGEESAPLRRVAEGG